MTTTKAVSHVDRSSRPRPPPSIDRLRASPETEEMLDWYFTRAGHDLAMGSNFGMLAEMARTGIGGAGDSDAFEKRHDRIAASVHRYRQVRALLACLTAENLDVLSARYELRQWPIELVQAFGRSTGVAVRTSVARRLYLRDSLKKRARWESVSVWLCGVVRRCERETLTLVRLETEAYEARAIASFEDIVTAADHAKAG
jgi:hypothetical protein